nr:acyltransferase [uncultured Erwinia sp.]
MKTIECSIRDVETGENVKIITPSNIYQCRLDDDVFVGPFVEIQKGCVIGRGSRVQSHSFLCENVTVGENCFVGHNVTFANDLFRSGAPNPDASSWITITVGDNVTIGSSATVLTTEICSGAVIGAGSVVIRPVTVKGIYAGNPARLIRKLA